MATTLRSELSEKSKYYVDKHRYYELKHFCLQYPEWKKAYLEMDGFGRKGTDEIRTNTPGDPTSRCVDLRLACLKRLRLIEHTAMNADPTIAEYILRAVTEGLSYPTLKTRFNIPCGRDMYYDRYRRFFWLLDQARR